MNIFSSLMKPKNKYSLDNLKYLYGTLVKNPIITPQNSSVIVETLRQIAEVLIWGDQNNPSLFEFFLEKNLLGFILTILEQKTSSDVTIQLLQTLSILVENLRKELSIYYLLSNNFINEIIIHKFDFSNEEVLDYYISFLKALSLKLDKSTVNFFFNGQEKDFPLYTEAIKFINHKETMVRIAVRTLTLNVFKVEDEAMRTYIINSTAVPYFSNIVWFIRQECAQLNKILEKSNHDNISQLNYYVEELTDQFYYLHDIFNLGFDSMNLVLAEQFIQYLIFPLLIGSLLENKVTPDPLEDRISPTLALFLLGQVFHIFTYSPLLDTVASAIASTTPSQSLLLSTSVSAPPPLTTLSSQRKHYNSFRRFSSFPNLEQLESSGGSNGSNSPISPRKKKNSLRLNLSGGSNNNSPQKQPQDKEKDKDQKEQKEQKETKLSNSGGNSNNNNNNGENKGFSDGEDDIESNMSSPNGDVLFGKGSNEFQTRIRSELSSSIDSGSTNMSGDSNVQEKRTSKKYNRNEFKEALLHLIRNDRETFGVVCMLFSFLKNTIIDRKILENGGMLPYRLAKAKKLLEGLLSPESRSPVMSSSMPNIPSHHRSKSESHTSRLSPSLGHSLGKRDLFSEVDDSFDLVIAKADPSTSALSSALKKQQQQQLQQIQQQQLQQQLSNMDPAPILKIIRPKGLKDDDEQQQEFIPVPDSSQTLFTRTLIDRLFVVMVNSNQFRLVTLQMTLLVLKELIYTPESPSKMTETQLSLLEEAYRVVTNNLRECLLNPNIAPFFLELFEEELRSYKQINFENLVKDVALILPVPETPISRLALSRRLPSGEVEKVQKAIQQFFVLRELKFTLLRRKDTHLPLKQPTIPLVREKDLFNLDTDNYDIIYYYQVAPQQAGQPQTKKKTRNCGVLFHNLLLNVDPNISTTPTSGSKSGIYGTITHIAPLQRLEIEQSQFDPTILRVFSHPTTWNVDMGFDEESKCQQAKQLLERARDDVRSSKMRQIYSLLGERDPDDDDPSNISSSTTPPLRVITPIVDASNSHPLAFSGEEVKPIGLQKPTTKISNNNNNNSNNILGIGKRFSIEKKESIFSSFLNDTDDNFLQNYKETNLLSETNFDSPLDDQSSTLFSAFKLKKSTTTEALQSTSTESTTTTNDKKESNQKQSINSSDDSVNTTNENELQSSPDESLEDNNIKEEEEEEIEQQEQGLVDSSSNCSNEDPSKLETDDNSNQIENDKSSILNNNNSNNSVDSHIETLKNSNTDIIENQLESLDLNIKNNEDNNNNNNNGEDNKLGEEQHQNQKINSDNTQEEKVLEEPMESVQIEESII